MDGCTSRCRQGVQKLIQSLQRLVSGSLTKGTVALLMHSLTFPSRFDLTCCGLLAMILYSRVNAMFTSVIILSDALIKKQNIFSASKMIEITSFRWVNKIISVGFHLTSVLCKVPRSVMMVQVQDSLQP